MNRKSIYFRKPLSVPRRCWSPDQQPFSHMACSNLCYIRAMDKINIRKATAIDLPTLLEFEQNLIQAERPFDPTLKDGHINYYNLAEMIDANDVEVAVVELDNKIIGSGYARIRNSQPYIKNERHAY